MAVLMPVDDRSGAEGALDPDRLLDANDGGFGMVPLAFALSEGSGQRAPMGQAVIRVRARSALLTLVVVPVLYSYLVRDRRPVPAARPADSAGTGAALPLPADRD